jgi:hypothetical protein
VHKQSSRLIEQTDRAAFANAYVAGLKEALNMTGDDYNKVLAVTTAGYVLKGKLTSWIPY